MIKVKRFVVGLLETNCYLVYDDVQKKAFLIDPGSFNKRVLREIEKNKLRVINIINTHGHADHIAGNREFGYPVLIHEGDSDFLKNPSKNLFFLAGMFSRTSMPSRFLKDGDVIREGPMSLEVIHTPGHTPGSVSLKLENRLFTGDALFREGIGRTDFPYADEKILLNSIKRRLLTFSDETEILPGHGESSTIGHEKKYNPFLQ